MVDWSDDRIAALSDQDLKNLRVNAERKSVADLKQDTNITILPLKNWWIQIASPNISNPPTDKLLVRQAIQAALDMDEIMDAASDGNYQLNVGFQYPTQPDYTGAGYRAEYWPGGPNSNGAPRADDPRVI